MAFDGIAVGETMRIEVFDSLLDLTRRAGGDSDAPGHGIFRALKRRGFDRAARAWSLRAMVRFHGRSGPPIPRPGSRRAEILFVSELSTPSTLEPSMLAARSLPPGSFMVACADPRSHRAWVKMGQRPHALMLSVPEERRVLASATSSAREAWRAFNADPPAFTFRGLDVSRDVLRALGPLVVRSAPWLAVERRALERTVELVAPSCVVVASDQHRIGRLTATLRAHGGWRLVVLQHGLPQDAIGYVPVVADVVAVWSPASTQWFVSHGTDPARLVETGNPRLDPLVRSNRMLVGAAAATELGLAGRPRLLLALSGLSSEASAAATRLVVDALRRMPEATLVIKLHPGGGNWLPVRRIVDGIDATTKSRVRILDRVRLDAMLSWADLVLVHRSSVAVEALAAGTPVAVADVGGQSIADLELAGLDLPRVTSGSDLAATAGDLMEEAARLRYMSARGRQLELVAGTLDGRSSDRVASLLLGRDAPTGEAAELSSAVVQRPEVVD